MNSYFSRSHCGWVGRSPPARSLGRFVLCLPPSRAGIAHQPLVVGVAASCDVPCSHAALKKLNYDAWLSARIRRSSHSRLAQLIAEFGGSMNDLHLAAAFTRLAHLQQRQETGCNRYTSPEINSRSRSVEASKSLWNKLPHDAQNLLIDQLKLRIDVLSARHVANILWSVARLRGLDGLLTSNDGLGQDIVSASLRSLPQCTAQELSCSIWALARLKWQNIEPGWISIFQQSCSLQWSNFNRQEMSMILWSLATLEWRDPLFSSRGNYDDDGNDQPLSPWMDQILSHQAPTLSLNELPLCELSISIWALARLRIHPPQSWCNEFAKGAYRRLCGFTSREISSIMWALPRIYGGRGGMLEAGHIEWRQRMPQHRPECTSLLDSTPFQLSPAMVVSRLAKQVMKRSRQLMMRGCMEPRHIAMCYHASTLMPEGLQSPPGIWSKSVKQALGGLPQSAIFSGPAQGHETKPTGQDHMRLDATSASSSHQLNFRSSSTPQTSMNSLRAVALTPHTASVMLCAMARDFRPPCDQPLDSQSLLRIASQQYVSSSSPNLEKGGSASEVGDSTHYIAYPQAGHMVSLFCAAVRLGLRNPPPGFMSVLQRITYLGRWELNPAELSSLFYALGKIGARLGRSKWLAELVLVSNRRAELFSAVQSIKVVWGLSRVGYAPSAEWIDGTVLQIQRKMELGQLPNLDASWEAASSRAAEGGREDLIQIKMDHGTLQYPDFSGSILSSVSPRTVSYSSSCLEARQLVFLLQGFSRLAPSSESTLQWLEELVNNVLAEAAMKGQLSARELAYTLWAAGHLSRPEKYQNQTIRTIRGLSNQHAGITDSRQKMKSDYRALRPPHRPLLSLSHQSAGALLQACCKCFSSFTPGQLAMTAYGVLLLGFHLDAGWVDTLLETSLSSGLPRYSDHNLTLLVNAGGRLKARTTASSQSRRWVRCVMGELELRAERLSPEQVLASLLGLAALGEQRHGSDTNEATADRTWLVSFINNVKPTLTAMQPWQLELSYNSAISLQPELSGLWGSNFIILLQSSGTQPGSLR